MEKLNYEEFFDYVWNEYVSERTVTDKFYRDNRSLIEDITYDIHHVYKSTGNISETVFAKVILLTFRNIVRIGVKESGNNDKNDAYEGF